MRFKSEKPKAEVTENLTAPTNTHRQAHRKGTDQQ